MKWLFALILVGFLVAGCKSQAPTTDPFFGRTTIPPPSTGSVTGRPSDPGYQPPPLAPASPQCPAGSLAPMVQMPSQPSAAASSMPARSAPASVAAPSGGNLPGVSPSVLAPRPSSTMPSKTVPPQPSSSTPALSAPASGVTSPYPSSGGAYNFRGTSTQGSTSAASAQPNLRASSPSFTNVAATRTSISGDDRMPKPVDNAAADGNLAGRQPIVRTIQPRARDDVSDSAVDIVDLPKSP